MRQIFFFLFLCCLIGCGYHRLDRTHKTVPWAARGETISLGRIYNNTKRGGLEEIFKKAVENRIMASSPWKLVTPGFGAQWILKGTIESFESVPLRLNLGGGQIQGSAGSATRVEIRIVISLQLVDGKTGAIVANRERLGFKQQYRLDQNFASFDNREFQTIETLADDFAESFLTQLLEGWD